ncbi:LuxR C-terminal-related transcriptional regulator [Leeia sp. TBRC 13508]|uniref:LuxR C-terminal-related transcriptional regulator n=1 Tax=Leeia speluncae TaxID=2884804 RepID=A0ABS8D5K2_9NEIS|nr:LuxR C-terminal-related transcriptional regulator [Leeia speluncae]MCB6183283.1 LuxR C-terminal-related transcriptional regulator [Leeia speluncae]
MLSLDNFVWHRAVGVVIESLDQDDFWLKLTRVLSDYVHFDSWVALVFTDHSPPNVLAEMPMDDGLADPLFEDYLNGLYVLDPFFIASRENRKEGLVRLDDVAPDRFKATEYYQRYFRLNIVEDELQINCLLPNEATLCLSLGSHQRIPPTALSLLEILSQWLIPLLRQRWHFEQIKANTVLSGSRPATKERVSALVNAKFNLGNSTLTTRELEISRLMLSGFSSKGIASRLGIATETVKVHRKHLYSKLGINSQSELFSLFLRETVSDVGVGE